MFNSYLHSDFHKFGCLFAIIGCVATLFDVLSLQWYWMLPLSYILGIIFFITISLYIAYQQDQQHPPPQTVHETAMIGSERIQHISTPDLAKHQQLLLDFEQLQKQSFPHLNPVTKQLMTEIHQVMQFMTQKINISHDNSLHTKLKIFNAV